MQRTRVYALFAGVAAASMIVACATTNGDTSKICTAIGCAAGMTLRTPLPGTFDQIRSFEISVCRNGECLSGRFATLNTPPAPMTGIGITFPDPSTLDQTKSAHVNASVSGDESHGFELEMDYTPWDFDDLKDGDVFAVTVRDAAGKTVTSTTRTVSYAVSYPNGKECGPVCRTATYDATNGRTDGGTPEGGFRSKPDAEPPVCILSEKSTLLHVHIVAHPTTCVFTLAEARAGISIPYDVVIDEDVPSFTPVRPYDYGPNLAGLSIMEGLAGGDQGYCECDLGYPWSRCPEADGGTFHPEYPSGCKPVTLPKGIYPRTFSWDGVNWGGPSDTGNPKGAPFPPGDYTLTIGTAPGSIQEDGGGPEAQATTEVRVRLVK